MSTNKTSKATRGGDTQRTSSQGQKYSSGGQISPKQKGAPERDDSSHNEIRDTKKPRRRRS